MVLIQVRDGSDLYLGSDWARLQRKLERFEGCLSYRFKDLNVGVKEEHQGGECPGPGLGSGVEGDGIRRAGSAVWGAGLGKGVEEGGTACLACREVEPVACVWVCVLVLSLLCPPFLSPHLWPLCRLFIDGDRTDAPSVKEHLLLDLGLEAEYRIQVLPYKSILSELKTLCASLSPREKVWVSDKASYAVSEAIPKVGSPRDPPKPATPAARPLPVLASCGLSLKQRLFRQISRTGCWVRGVVSLDEPFGLECEAFKPIEFCVFQNVT